MVRKRRNNFGKGNGRFVKLPFAIIDSEAYRSLKPPAKAILIGLIRRYNGNNNGYIPYGCREAASDNSISLNTAARNFHALEASGLIKCITASNFNCRKKMAREWALTFHGVDGAPPSGEWKHFKTKPSTKNDGYSTKRDTNVFKLENLKIV